MVGSRLARAGGDGGQHDVAAHARSSRQRAAAHAGIGNTLNIDKGGKVEIVLRQNPCALVSVVRVYRVFDFDRPRAHHDAVHRVQLPGDGNRAGRIDGHAARQKRSGVERIFHRVAGIKHGIDAGLRRRDEVYGARVDHARRAHGDAFGADEVEAAADVFVLVVLNGVDRAVDVKFAAFQDVHQSVRVRAVHRRAEKEIRDIVLVEAELVEHVERGVIRLLVGENVVYAVVLCNRAHLSRRLRYLACPRVDGRQQKARRRQADRHVLSPMGVQSAFPLHYSHESRHFPHSFQLQCLHPIFAIPLRGWLICF